MALFGQAKTEDVATLIAKKNYSKAIDVIREQLATRKDDPRVKMQLGDVLVLAGKGNQAITIYLALADEFAKEGFAAKAISVLKKIQKIDPGRRDVDAKLASLIQEKQRQATVTLPPAAPALEIGMEEIGFEAAGGGAPARYEPPPELEPELEMGMAGPAPEPEPEAPPPPPPPRPKPATVVDQDLFIEGELEAIEPEPLQLEPEPEPAEAEPLLLEPEPATADADIILEPEAALEPEPEPVADPMTDSAFADELMSVFESAFPGEDGTAAPFSQDSGDSGASSAQIVVSPLFKDFSVDELVAVIGGLNLITFEAGAIIITQGDAGHSLYMLTSGKVKCFKKNAQGRQSLLGVLDEGAFFGEVSILTGQPRTATVVASTYCELLELDRPTLDGITQKHPHVRQVLQEFCDQRLKKKV